MPELPEVEIMVRQLRARLRDSTIREVEVPDSKIKLDGELVRARIQDVRRRAKFIIIDLSKNRYLLIHLRMTGWFEFIKPLRYRFALHTTKGSTWFEDFRRFGSVELLTPEKLAARLSDLGPEPLGADLDLSALLRTSRHIKVALLDQRLIAGVGNIYASESLWRAKIDPRRKACRLKEDEFRRLRRSIVKSLTKSISYGDRIFDVQQFAVYDRAGKPCLRCGTQIRRIVQAQRGTFFCPNCQH